MKFEETLLNVPDLEGATFITPVGMFRFQGQNEPVLKLHEDGARPVTQEEWRELLDFIGPEQEED